MNNITRRNKTERFRRYIQSSVRRMRLERKWSQATLAKKLGVDQATISNYESGKTDMSSVQLFEVFLIFGKDLTNALDFAEPNSDEVQENDQEKE